MIDRSKLRYLAIAGVAGIAAFAGWRLVRPRQSNGEPAYAPLDVPKPVAPGLWIVDGGPLRPMGLTVPIRMTVVKLSDGGLVLHSPTPYSSALGDALAAIGTVRHLVAPSFAHWLFLSDWQRAFPDATSWGVPVLRTRKQVRRSGVRIDHDLADAAPDVWAEELDQGLVDGRGGFEEAWFFHRASRTLVLTDLIENLAPDRLPPVTALAARAAAATSGTAPVQIRTALALNGAGTREAIARMVATSPDRVLVTHGDPIETDAASRLEQAFAWLV